MSLGTVDPMQQFDHDHATLSKLALEVRSLVEAAEAPGAQIGEIHAALADALALLREDLLHHFAREEEGLFPFVLEHLPDLGPQVERLAAAHDAICGTIMRMAHIAERDADAFARQLATITSLHARFEATYADHARDERELLEALPRRIDAHHRAELRALLEGL
jgi:hypothetical protein